MCNIRNVSQISDEEEDNDKKTFRDTVCDDEFVCYPRMGFGRYCSGTTGTDGRRGQLFCVCECSSSGRGL